MKVKTIRKLIHGLILAVIFFGIGVLGYEFSHYSHVSQVYYGKYLRMDKRLKEEQYVMMEEKGIAKGLNSNLVLIDSNTNHNNEKSFNRLRKKAYKNSEAYNKGYIENIYAFRKDIDRLNTYYHKMGFYQLTYTNKYHYYRLFYNKNFKSEYTPWW